MNRLRANWRWIALAILITITTIWLATTSFVEDFLAPLAYLVIRQIATIFSALPSSLIWIVCTLVMLQLLLANLIRFATRTLDLQDQTPDEPDEEFLGPVEKYSRWVQQSGQGDYFKARLSRQLGRLARTLLESENKGELPTWQWDQKVSQNAYQFPADVQTFLQSGSAKHSDPKSTRSRLGNLVPIKAEPVFDEIVPTIEYLEDKLNDSNNSNNRSADFDSSEGDRR